MKYFKSLFITLLLVSLVGCATWSESYSKDYGIYLAGRADCTENDKFTVEVPQANGADPIMITSPAGHCSDIDGPRHSGDVYMPAITGGIAAGALVGAQYLNNSANVDINKRNAEASEFISRQNRLSDQSLFSTFGRISDSNAAVTGALITTNENLTNQVISDSMVEDPAPEPVVTP